VQIASGWCKGLKIDTPSALTTRPTRSRVRASVLNLLQPWIHEAVVLDLFAGTGAVGIELVSRGASGAVFVENSTEALKALRQNTLELEARAVRCGVKVNPLRVLKSDATTCLRNFAGVEVFDLVWADPPYELVPEFCSKVAAHLSAVLKDGGVFALESGIESQAAVDQVAKAAGMCLVKQRAYGVTLVSIWQKLAP